MSDNAKIIWDFLKNQGLTDAGAAGLMGNLFAESGLNPQNLQNSYEKKLKHTNESYTKAVDNGTYKKFVKDSAGYGLAQWTYWSRKEKLLNFSKQKNSSIGDLQMQLEFLVQELTTAYSVLLNLLRNTTSVEQASNEVLFKFEKPADQGVTVQKKRATYAQRYYDQFANAQEEPFIVCMQTNSTCYKQTRTMQPIGVLWHSTGVNNPNLSRYIQPLETDYNYNQMISLIGKNKYGNDYNHSNRNSGLNCWIGKLADGTVATVQTMPWNYRPWGCGSGAKGSCNNGFIQFEICEDRLTDANYFNAVYAEACKITAYLCKLYNIDPKGTVKVNGVTTPTILCHADSYKLGLGSNHADVLHWFKLYGKTMDDVRSDVEKLMTGEVEEEVTQEQFNKMMDNWIAEQANKEPSDWSKDARKWAEKNALVKGDERGNKMYKKIITREELVEVLYRALHRYFID